MNRSNVAPGTYPPLYIPLALLAMVLAIFGRALFGPGGQVLSKVDTDISGQFIYWRQFGFDQLRAGHVALWNPHVFSGAPFMSAFQSALFYPPNWIYLILPLTRAINCEIVLHVFLLGFFMALWVRRYQLHPLAVLFACSLVMFGGPVFPQTYAGHLAELDAMAWVPLILLTFDNLIDAPDARWVLIGVLAFAMQFLAGHPLVVFKTVAACGLYGAMRLIKAPRRSTTVLCLAAVGIASLLIVTVQLWSGWETANESTREGGAKLAFAASFSLPPENLITMLVPDFFGNLNVSSYLYWGRWFLWDLWPFFGLTGLAMALFALMSEFSYKRIWVVTALVLLWIALGEHTPLFWLLYRYVPGFSYFRSLARFTFEALLFLAMLAAFGTDALLRSARGTRVAAAACLATGVLLAGLGLWMRSGGALTMWNGLVNTIARSGESYIPANAYADPSFNLVARRFAGSQCLIAGAILIILAALFFARSYRAYAAYATVAFGIAEIFAFAHSAAISFPFTTKTGTVVRNYLDAHPGDYRTLGLSNSAIMIGANDIWGYDPVVMRRYEELVGFSQNAAPDDPNLMPLRNIKTPLFRLLRLGLVFAPEAGGYKVSRVEGSLPHLQLVDRWTQIGNHGEILNALSAASFDPTRTIVLESAPTPAPVPGIEPGVARLEAADNDSLTIAADLPRPMLLLITDSYSRYWRAVPLPGSSQDEYQVMPADYALMAVPMAAGHHLMRLEYAPPGWIIGRWISLAALMSYLLALGIFVALRRRTRSL